MEVFKLEFRELLWLAKTSFEKIQSVTYERYKLFIRKNCGTIKKAQLIFGKFWN